MEWSDKQLQVPCPSAPSSCRVESLLVFWVSTSVNMCYQRIHILHLWISVLNSYIHPCQMSAWLVACGFILIMASNRWNALQLKILPLGINCFISVALMTIFGGVETPVSLLSQDLFRPHGPDSVRPQQTCPSNPRSSFLFAQKSNP